MGSLRREQGRYEEACRHHEAAIPLLEGTPYVLRRVSNLLDYGSALKHSGRLDEA